MSRILLADHSPHAQRMGERILRDEGYEVATVTDGETALLRLKDGNYRRLVERQADGLDDGLEAA